MNWKGENVVKIPFPPDTFINWANGAGGQATLSPQVMGHRALFVFYFGWGFRVPQNQTRFEEMSATNLKFCFYSVPSATQDETTRNKYPISQIL